MLPFIPLYQSKYVASIITILLALSILQTVLLAQNGVDVTFNASVTNELPANFQGNVVLQNDGKIIVFNNTQITRFNQDGSSDGSFNYCGCGLAQISSVIIQPNGKYLAAGFIFVSSLNAAKVIRLNSDGSLDNSFISPFPTDGGSSSGKVFQVQPDGKSLVEVVVSLPGFSTDTLYRLNADGSLDSSFTPIGIGAGRNRHFLAQTKVDSNGQIYVSGGFSGVSVNPTGFLYRHNADGSRDPIFEAPTSTRQNLPGTSVISDFEFSSDGSIFLAGYFTAINGVPRTSIAKLTPNGGVDLSFIPPDNFGEISKLVKLTSNGKIVFSVPSNTLYRLNPNGSLDTTFNAPSNLVSVQSWAMDAAERILLIGTLTSGNSTLIRLNPNGSLDTSFRASISTPGNVNAIQQQTDGKILIGGSFSKINGVERNGLARVNTDGSVDSTFNVGNGFNSPPTVLAVQSDNKVLVAGSFSTFNGDPVQRLVRLNANGTIDTSFAFFTDSAAFNSIILQPDGKILIGGIFNSINGFPRTQLARLNANGSIDGTFNPLFGTGNINSVFLQSDGKIVAGGAFTGVNGFARNNLVRLNADGSLDTTFNANAEATSPVAYITGANNNSYIIATTSRVIKKLTVNGTADTSFQTATVSYGTSNTPFVSSLLVQSDGKIIVGGAFDNVNGISRSNLMRLNANGTLDSFYLPSGTNFPVNTLLAQTDGKVLVGGSFSTINGVSRVGLARILPLNVPRNTNFDFDGDGKADIAVYRPNTNVWYILQSSDLQLKIINFGIEGDIVAPADFDGDGKTDLGIFRPTQAGWWYQSSVDGLNKFGLFGANGDIPRPSDFSGDGRADYITVRPTNLLWSRYNIANNQQSNSVFGVSQDIPLIGDFNADGRSDLTIYRPNTGEWWWQSSGDGIQRATRWGVATDKPAPADYDGDGKTDFAVFRPQTGVWYILNSGNGSFTVVPFGLSEDKPVPADYDGDGKADIAVYRPSTGLWYLLRSTSGFTALQFGVATDVPIPNAFVP